MRAFRIGATVSVPAQAPRGEEASAPTPAAPTAASHDVVAEAQAFLDQAFSGNVELPTDDAGADAIASDDANVQDAGEATPATPATEPSAAAEAAAEESQPSTTEKSRRERAAEAKAKAKPVAEAQPAPAPAPTPSREEVIAQWQQEQEAARAAERAQQERLERFGRFTGEIPADPANPAAGSLYQRLQAVANQPIPQLGYDADQNAFDNRERVIVEANRARAQLAELDERRAMLDAVRTPAETAARQQALAWTGERIEQGVTSLGLDVQQIVAAGAGKPDPLVPMIVAVGQQVRQRVEAELKPQIAELTEERDAQASEIAELRRQLGGRAPQVARGGTPSAPARMSIDALDAIPVSRLGDEIGAYLDLLPPATGRRR